MKRISVYDTRKINLTSSDGIDLLFIWKRVKISRLTKIFIFKILKLIYIFFYIFISNEGETYLLSYPLISNFN